MGRIIQRDNMPIGQPAQLKRVWRDQLRSRDQLLGDGPCQGFIAIKPAMVTKGRVHQNGPARSVKSAEGILNDGDLPDMADIPGHDCIQPIPPVQAFYPHDNCRKIIIADGTPGPETMAGMGCQLDGIDPA